MLKSICLMMIIIVHKVVNRYTNRDTVGNTLVSRLYRRLGFEYSCGHTIYTYAQSNS